MRFAVRLLLLACVLLPFSTAARAEEQAPPVADEKQPPEQAERNAQFARLLSGATLVGHYTLSDQPLKAPLKEERYTIRELKYIAGDTWRFLVRIEYGEHDVTLPLPLPVKWAGDTPVITVKRVAIPGLGTYSARVLIHDGYYAGTWNGGDHGGHLFGRIQREKPDDEAEKKQQ